MPGKAHVEIYFQELNFEWILCFPLEGLRAPYTHFRGVGRGWSSKCRLQPEVSPRISWFCSLKPSPFHHGFLAIRCQLFLHPNFPTNKYLSKYNLNIQQPVCTSFLDSFLWAWGHWEQKQFFFTLEIIRTTQKVQKSWPSPSASTEST